MKSLRDWKSTRPSSQNRATWWSRTKHMRRKQRWKTVLATWHGFRIGIPVHRHHISCLPVDIYRQVMPQQSALPSSCCCLPPVCGRQLRGGFLFTSRSSGIYPSNHLISKSLTSCIIAWLSCIVAHLHIHPPGSISKLFIDIKSWASRATPRSTPMARISGEGSLA